MVAKIGTALGHSSAATRPQRPDVAAGLIALSMVGVTFLEPRLGPNGAFVDAALLLLVALGLRVMAVGGAPPAVQTWRATWPWLFVIAIGTALSLYSSGVTGWALIDIAQSVYSVAVFFGCYALIWRRRRLLPIFAIAIAVGILVTTVSLVLTLEPGVRPSGAFYHPNYAGHYLVVAAVVCWWASPWRLLKVAAVAVAGLGVYLTGSFGALIMAGAFVAYILLRAARQRPWVLAFTGAVVLTLVAIVTPSTITAQLRQFTVSDTITSTRFERSEGGRLGVWEESLSTVPDHPLGVGPDGLHNRQMITFAREPHNLYVAFLAERGVIGLVGLIGLGVALWRQVPAGGLSRPLIVTLAVGNVFRETFHYRHMWLLLAVAVVIDLSRRERAERQAQPDEEAESRALLRGAG
ncbi:MAG TPA: O-antigen ligase family protein [Actinomycetales bacterium]|nr:O-antigen ligase family protein [Actinomycetales bacterium]